MEKVDLYGEGGLVSSLDRLPASDVSHIRMSARYSCLTKPGSGGEDGPTYDLFGLVASVRGIAYHDLMAALHIHPTNRMWW